MGHNAMVEAFANEPSARRYLESVLWPDGPVCPRCGVRGGHRMLGRTTRAGAHRCRLCRTAFSITDGTVFEKSRVPLRKWLQAIYLTGGGSIPIRPCHIARILDVSDRSATDMLERLNDAGDKSCRCRTRRVSEALQGLLHAA
jgi:transposase-like protein